MCQITTCIRFPGQLLRDLCEFAVNVIPFPSCVRDGITIMFTPTHDVTRFVENGSRICCGPSGPAFALVNVVVRGQSFTEAQLPRPAIFSVESQRVQAYERSWSVGVERVDHTHLRSFTPRAHCENNHVQQQSHITTRITRSETVKVSWQAEKGPLCLDTENVREAGRKGREVEK